LESSEFSQGKEGKLLHDLCHVGSEKVGLIEVEKLRMGARGWGE
jgi:hypothetical protein